MELPENYIETTRTNKAAYMMGRRGENRDSERWCDLLNESRSIECDLVKAKELLSEALDHIESYDDGMSGWLDETRKFLS